MRGEDSDDEASLMRWLSEMEFSLIADGSKESLKDGEETELETECESSRGSSMCECGEEIKCEISILILQKILEIDLNEI